MIRVPYDSLARSHAPYGSAAIPPGMATQPYQAALQHRRTGRSVPELSLHVACGNQCTGIERARICVGGAGYLDPRNRTRR